MRRIFTFLVVLATLLAGTAEAQPLQKLGTVRPLTTNHRAAIEAGANQTWWGYMGSATTMSSIGMGQAGTFHCAMFLTGQDDMTKDKTLRALRFSLTAPNVADVKVWTAATLPAGTPDASNTLWCKAVDKSELGQWVDVALDEPYAIPTTGVYVGYSFTVTAASTTDDQYPIAVAGSTDHPYGLFISTGSSWDSLYGQGFGALAMQALLEGEFATHCVAINISDDEYTVKIGDTVDVPVLLTNNGQETVSSISYTLNGGAEQTLTLANPLACNDAAVITLAIPAAATEQSEQQELTVTKVNGQANQSVAATVSFTLKSVARLITRNVVVEEFTGTGCGWCPRGLAGMEKLRQTFGDRFIGIGIHQYNSSDAMYIANYPNSFNSAPSCMINRDGNTIDPYYGSTTGDICDDFRTAMNKPATVGVTVSGVINEAETEVNVTASIESLFDTSDYSIEYVIVGDGLSGTTTAWKQSNYYATNYNQNSNQPDDLKEFCGGGKYGQSSISGWVFNDVALKWAGGTEVESLGTLSASEMREVSHTLVLPTKATLRNAMKKGTLYAVALLVGKDGRIANAGKGLISDGTGVCTIHTSDGAASVASYSLNGTQLSAPQRGINIVRMADGTVRKVIVK